MINLSANLSNFHTKYLSMFACTSQSFSAASIQNSALSTQKLFSISHIGYYPQEKFTIVNQFSFGNDFKDPSGFETNVVETGRGDPVGTILANIQFGKQNEKSQAIVAYYFPLSFLLLFFLRRLCSWNNTCLL